MVGPSKSERLRQGGGEVKNENSHLMNSVTVGTPGSLGPGWLNKEQLAQRFNVTVRTIETWMKQYHFPRYRIGRKVLFKEHEVEAHLQNFRQG